eukprot:11063062-Heterocapsa_arctica.AAC.1
MRPTGHAFARMALRRRQPGSASTVQHSYSARPCSVSLEVLELSTFWVWSKRWKKVARWLCSGTCGV